MYILWTFGLFYGHLVYLTAIWYILWPLGIFLVIWYIFPRMGKLYQENLATLARNAEITFSSGTTIVMRLT
jgi:hypothetical protein